MTVAMPRNKRQFTYTRARAIVEQRRGELASGMEESRSRLAMRGLKPIQRAAAPPTDAELQADFWWYHGGVKALDELLGEFAGGTVEEAAS